MPKAAPSPDLAKELREIRARLDRQQEQLDVLRAERAPPPSASAPHGHLRLKVTLVLALFVLAVAGAGAYQYYRILQSIIDQYPHSSL